MEQLEFDRAIAEALMMMTSFPQASVIRDDGIFIDKEFRSCSPCEQAFDWTPAYDMDWPASPNALTAPALPIPFTSGELAAFMLDGHGAGIQQHLNSRIGYPLNDAALAGFGKRTRLVSAALRDAYALAVQAQSVVGVYDHEEQRRAYELLRQLDDANGHANEDEGVFEQGITDAEASQRRARAVASVGDLKAKAESAKVEVDGKWSAWRAAMVKQLLHPVPQVMAPSLAPMASDHEEFQLLWRAVHFDEKRVEETLNKIGNMEAKTLTECAYKEKKIPALRAELSQIQGRMDFLRQAKAKVVHAADRRWAIDEMTESRRPRMKPVEESRRLDEIKDANAIIDERIAAATPSGAPVRTPDTVPETQAAPPPSVVPDVEDPERRLTLLRALGGSAKYSRGEWKFKGIGALVASEKASKFRRCDEKTIRADLKEAAQAERDASSAWPFDGIGQR